MWCHQKGSMRASILPAASVQEGEDALLSECLSFLLDKIPSSWVLKEERGKPFAPYHNKEKVGQIKAAKDWLWRSLILIHSCFYELHQFISSPFKLCFPLLHLDVVENISEMAFCMHACNWGCKSELGVLSQGYSCECWWLWGRCATTSSAGQGGGGKVTPALCSAISDTWGAGMKILSY